MGWLRRIFRPDLGAAPLADDPEEMDRQLAALRRLRDEGRLEDCANWCEANLPGWSRD